MKNYTELVKEIVEVEDLKDELLEYLVENSEETVKDAMKLFLFNELPTHLGEDEEKIVALALHEGEGYEDCQTYIESGDYLVLTDEEADEAWEEDLNNYIDDCLIPELPETAQRYFDRESWISDAKMDGRGHCLSRYDGTEYYQDYNGTTYYIYRQN